MDTAERQVLLEDQHLAASTSSVEEQHSRAFSTESLYWTSIDSTPRPEHENVRVFPGKEVPKFQRKQIQLLEKIGEGGQGYVTNAKFAFQMQVDLDARYVRGLEKNPTYVDVAGWDGKVVVAKTFKGKLHENHFGQWPEELFGIHGLCRYICKFYGYCNDGDSFMLLMEKYDCSLHESIDKHMKKGTYKGRPFHGPVALSIIIQIAIGMAYLHQLNIIHGDLKADNILVMNIGEDDDTPAGVFIADFDVASTIHGTAFWRAPEILQALKNRDKRFSLKPPLTTKADVYSFGMTCYEILTGGIPLMGTEFGNYDVVLSGKRPTLPSNLNHEMKDLLTRCWHHDPDVRPTFKEIVSELQGFVAGTEVLMQLFTLSNAFGDVDESDLESNLVKLKQLAHVLAENYSQALCLLTDRTGDFVALGFEYIDVLEEFKAQFGFQSFKEHLSLPLLEDFSRANLYDKIIHKGNMFRAACPQVLPEYIPFSMLMGAFINMPTHKASQSINKSFDIEQNVTEEHLALIFQSFTARNEQLQRQAQVNYSNRHEACHELLTSKQAIVNDNDQPCDLCKGLPFYAPRPPHMKVCTFHLYEDKYKTFKSVFTWLVQTSKKVFLYWPKRVVYR